MDQFERIVKMHLLFKNCRYPVNRKKMEEQLGCSRATVRRHMDELKDYLGAPIVYDAKYKGYHYDEKNGKCFELPGLWFNAGELQALLTMQHLLLEIQPGFLDEHLKPLKERIESLLTSRMSSNKKISNHVRIIGMGKRKNNPYYFQKAADSVLTQKQIIIKYHSRSDDKQTQRVLSPQRLVHYRDNWYLDAWDHDKKALRSFAIDRIIKIEKQKEKSRKIKSSILENHFATAYGIFAGKPKHTAVLKFDSNAARWVAEETWHPKQESEYKDDYYILKVPYSDSRELIMDILKYGERVEVLEPKQLREELKKVLKDALKKY